MKHAVSKGHNDKKLRILEVGSGTGGATFRILNKFNWCFVQHATLMLWDVLNLLQTVFGDSLAASVEYTCTESNYSLLQKITGLFEEFSDILTFKVFDLEKNVTGQGLSLETYGIKYCLRIT